MSSETTLAAEQCRFLQWAVQIRDYQIRLANMSIVSWCSCHGITKANYYYRLRRVRENCLENSSAEMSLRQIVPVEPGLLLTDEKKTVIRSRGWIFP